MSRQRPVHPDPVFFETPADFRAWLEENHETADELWVGLYKKATGRPSITWPEVVDQALCFGWIDGVRKSVDGESYMNRVTPRRAGSNWSAVNIKRFRELEDAGLVTPAGRAAFDRRREADDRSEEAALGEEYEARFQSNPRAWAWFHAQAPWYRRAATRWVVSAKKEETRERRLARLIEDSANGRTIPPLTRPG